jgi:hypothetical protein
MICGRQLVQVRTYSYVLSVIASSCTLCRLPIWHHHFRHNCTFICMFGVMLSTNVTVEQNTYNKQLHVSNLQTGRNMQLFVKIHIVFDYYIYWFLAY